MQQQKKKHPRKVAVSFFWHSQREGSRCELNLPRCLRASTKPLSSNLRTQSRASTVMSLIRHACADKMKKHHFCGNKDYTGRFTSWTKFAEEFPCEHGTSFRQICEPNPVQARWWAWFSTHVPTKWKSTTFVVLFHFGDPYGNRTHVFSVRG